ncbi:DUF4124 domain-containing protein [Glaciimonas immobilis]|nr:DUF4124 domain-containing protein [Glaciimonas immobilis]
MLCIGSAAMAQYIWLDEKGIKQYSDMPPPLSVPVKRILKMPGNFSVPATAANGDPKDDKDAQNVAKAPPTLIEQNAAFNKRKNEQAEKDKKATDAAKSATNKTKACDSARAYQRTLNSGQRIAQIDKNGQRAFFDDNQRQQASRENQQVLDECK